MIGGVGYIVLNVLNGWYRKEPIGDAENLRSLAIAGGVAGGGFIESPASVPRKKRQKIQDQLCKDDKLSSHLIFPILQPQQFLDLS